MRREMHVDIETYSSIDLTESGVYRYVEAPDFDILLIGYSLDGGEVRVIDTQAEARGKELGDFLRLLTDPDVIKTAYNANFERTCFAKWTGEEMPPEQWRDTMIYALEMGLPRSLADAGIALGLPEDKLKDPQGKALIRYFSVPCRPTKSNGGRTRNFPGHDPDKWELYKRYNRQDVVTETEISTQVGIFKIAPSEWELWELDQRMNDLGVKLDVPMIKSIVAYDEKRRAELLQEAKGLTGLKNPNSLIQLKEWLRARGIIMESVTKESVEEKLGEDLPEDVRRVLLIRSALGKSSVAKYHKMLDAVCEDGRLRGILQFYGANRSGRWAGKMVQTHNLARNSLPDLELARELVKEGDFDSLTTLFGEASFVFSELVRTAFIPSEGCRFVVSDFSAIEARVISWVSGEEWRLDAFREGKDIYCESASQMYHVPVVKHGINGELRQKGKIAELALGYQGGVGAMKSMDRGGSIPEEEMQEIVDTWRGANPMIVKLWKDYEAAAKTAISEHRTVRRGIRVPAHNLEEREYMADGPVREYSVREGCRIEFSYVGGNLFIKLPSGRKLCYWGARLKDDGWGQKIMYKGVDQTTRQWKDVETYGGKIVENIVQAIARDCLADVMKRVTAAGYRIVMHVHDEIIADVPMEDQGAAEAITDIMNEDIGWAPGLPLKGETYETAFYRKD